ncbi:MAG: DUF362 domain-containing protein [Chloroflexota bacterium]
MKISRRRFLRDFFCGLAGAVAAGFLAACGVKPKPSPSPSPSPSPTSTPSPTPSPTAKPAPAPPTVLPNPAPGAVYLAVARGKSPAVSPRALLEAALKALGGIEGFVPPGAEVIIKPNICVAYHTYEYAATTNPEVVAALVRLCLGAGARRVRVMDAPFGGTAEQAYAKSGIAEAVKAAGGQMEVMSRMKYAATAIPAGRDITRWPVYQDVLKADVLINVPIAKHHNLARLTLGMKNLMGVVLDRNQLHTNLGQRVADLASLIRPHLTVIDAVRILTNHGPTGGNLADVKFTNTIIASPDIVAADAYAATLFGLKGADIPATRAGAQMGLGVMDLSRIKIEEVTVDG